MKLFLVLAISAGFAFASELWCIANDEDDTKVNSNFVCYTDHNEFIYPICDKNNCSYLELPPQKDSKLFHSIFQDEFVHIKVTEPSVWNGSVCNGFNLSPFDLGSKEQNFLLKYILNTQDSDQFWITGRRQGYSFSPAVWQLPGRKWGELIDEPYDEFSPFDCVSVKFDADLSFKIAMQNCSVQMPIVCIFKGDPFVRSACGKGSFALRTTPDRCYRREFGVYSVADLENRDYIEMQNDHAPKYLAAKFDLGLYDKCTVYRHQATGYTVSFTDTGQFHTGINNTERCVVRQFRVQKSKNMIQMFLMLHPSSKTILLTVYNRKEIWCDDDDRDSECGIKCFTNADYEQLVPVKIKKLVWEDEKKSIFELKLYGNDPGYYWCEAHSIHNFELIESAKIVATKKQKGHPFAFFFNVPCHIVSCNRINSNLESYGKKIRKLLIEMKEKNVRYRNSSRMFNIHNVRVMTIERFILGDSIHLLCHATLSLKGSSVDNSSEEDDYEYIEDVKDKFEREIEIRDHLRRLFGDLVGRSPYGITTTVNSTEFCFAESTITLNRTWQHSQLGASTTTKRLCLLPTGLPIFRKCVGDFVYGATWEEIDPRMKCVQKITKKIMTEALYDIDNTKKAEYRPTETITKVETLMNDTKKFIPADLFYLGRIMQSVAKTIITSIRQNQGESNQTQAVLAHYDDLSSTDSILRIYNSLMDVERHVFRPAVKLNSTNTLLDAFEKIFNRLAIRNESGSTATQPVNNLGIIVHRSSKLITFIIDPSISNYSGIALFANQNSEDFKNSHYRLLLSNESAADLLQEENLEIAAFVPETLLERLDEIPAKINETLVVSLPPIKVVIKIYFNDKLFQEDRDIVHHHVFSRIISITIPGYDSDLPEYLPLFMKADQNASMEPESGCRYWNYTAWTDEGLQFLARSKTNNNVVMCGCSHLTPFSYLVGGSYNLSVTSDNVIITELHLEALDMITVLGCSLSLIGIMGIIITAIIFEKWREKPTSKVILNFSIAIAFQMILFLFVNTDVLTLHLLENQIFSSCIILGACLHYSVLVQFSWMLIIAYLQYKRYVQVLGNARPPRFFIKAFLLGWCLPLLPVLLVVLIDKQSYIPIDNRSRYQICYPAGQALVFGVLMPIISIIAANLIIFLLVIYNIIRGPKEKIRQVDRSFALSQVRLSILLFFLLGFTWIFGLLTTANISLIFSYLFSLTATIQGFVIFVYFVVLDPVTRNMWSRFLKALCCSRNMK